MAILLSIFNVKDAEYILSTKNLLIKDTGIEVYLQLLKQSNKSFIPWSEITYVRRYGFWIFAWLQIFFKNL